jgi:bifunctional DNase/RNase
LHIDQKEEPDYSTAKVTHVGFIDPYALEGIVILQSDDKKEFHMRAFSGEVARHIKSFVEGKRDNLPTIYNMIEQLCEENELYLVKVKVYESGSVLRANLYFTGKKDIVLRNYRASDAVALGVFYNIPILVRKNLLKESLKV